MGYNKFVVFGKNVEFYEYQKSLLPSRRNVKTRPLLSGLASGRDDLSSPKKKKKRSGNVRNASVAFKRLLYANFERSGVPLLVTFTYAISPSTPRQGYRDFTSFIQSLRYRLGGSFSYVAVAEFQKRGAIHFHALFWGLSVELARTERQTRFFGKTWGLGFVDVSESVPVGGSFDRLISYLSKYLSKAYSDSRLWGLKSYFGSRNLARPYIVSNFSPSWPVLDDWGLSTVLPCEVKHFDSQWLGSCRVSYYKLLT